MINEPARLFILVPEGDSGSRRVWINGMPSRLSTSKVDGDPQSRIMLFDVPDNGLIGKLQLPNNGRLEVYGLNFTGISGVLNWLHYWDLRPIDVVQVNETGAFLALPYQVPLKDEHRSLTFYSTFAEFTHQELLAA